MRRSARRWALAFLLAGLLSLGGNWSGARADTVSGLNPYGDNYLSLRTGPGTRYREIMRMGPGTYVRVLGRDGNWLRVELDDGTVGWAYAKYIYPDSAGGPPPPPPPPAPFPPFDAQPGLNAGPPPPSVRPGEGEWTDYLNARYGTSISYPADYFIPQPPPENNDGRRFESVDGQSSFYIFAQYNALGMTLEEMRADDIASGDYDSVTYQRSGPDWYVLSGYRQGLVFYKKVLLHQDEMHVFEITYPKEAKPALDPVTTRMAGSFRASGR